MCGGFGLAHKIERLEPIALDVIGRDQKSQMWRNAKSSPKRLMIDVDEADVHCENANRINDRRHYRVPVTLLADHA